MLPMRTCPSSLARSWLQVWWKCNYSRPLIFCFFFKAIYFHSLSCAVPQLILHVGVCSFILGIYSEYGHFSAYHVHFPQHIMGLSAGYSALPHVALRNFRTVWFWNLYLNHRTGIWHWNCCVILVYLVQMYRTLWVKACPILPWPFQPPSQHFWQRHYHLNIKLSIFISLHVNSVAEVHRLTLDP